MRLERPHQAVSGALPGLQHDERLDDLAALLVRWPWLAPAVPALALVYAAFILYRFRFALRYPAYRLGWLAVPLVKLTMDLGSEVGRLKALFSPKGA